MTPEEFAALRRELHEEVIVAMALLFSTLGSWRDTDRDVFLEQAIPIIRGGQTELANLTSAWIALRATYAAGVPVDPPAIPDTAAVNLRRGVEDRAVYERPFSTLYNALSEGKPLDEAVHLGEVRLREIAEFDLQQTYAEASHAAMEGLPAGIRPQFWRRVLVGPENCAMCVIASTQRYRVETLNPIHPGCDCAVDALFGPQPEPVIDEELLERAHAAVEELTGVSDRGGRAPDYRQVIAEHSELGELLVRPRDQFTSADDL